jgi:hypothetical protein
MARQISNVEARSNYKQRLLLGFVLKPLRLICDSCDKSVFSDMHWECGYCGHANIRTKIYSFLTKCRECKRPPKSYVCPHCEVLNFLDEDNDGAHSARAPAKDITPLDPALSPNQIKAASEKASADAQSKERAAQKAQLRHEIEVAQLNAQLAELKASADLGKEKPIREKLEESFSTHDAQAMGALTIAREQKMKNAERFKDDPDLQAMADESVDSWLESQM